MEERCGSLQDEIASLEAALMTANGRALDLETKLSMSNARVIELLHSSVPDRPNVFGRDHSASAGDSLSKPAGDSKATNALESGRAEAALPRGFAADIPMTGDSGGPYGEGREEGEDQVAAYRVTLSGGMVSTAPPQRNVHQAMESQAVVKQRGDGSRVSAASESHQGVDMEVPTARRSAVPMRDEEVVEEAMGTADEHGHFNGGGAETPQSLAACLVDEVEEMIEEECSFHFSTSFSTSFSMAMEAGSGNEAHSIHHRIQPSSPETCMLKAEDHDADFVIAATADATCSDLQQPDAPAGTSERPVGSVLDALAAAAAEAVVSPGGGFSGSSLPLSPTSSSLLGDLPPIKGRQPHKPSIVEELLPASIKGQSSPTSQGPSLSRQEAIKGSCFAPYLILGGEDDVLP